MSGARPVGLLTTPLYSLYSEFGAKVVDFSGWALPVQFSGVIDEHKAVRANAGLFDASHMGEIEVSGPDAEGFLQKLTVNDVTLLKNGQIQYSAMCFPDGGIVDDITVFRFSQEKYLLCVNASNRAKDLVWIVKNSSGDVKINDISAETALLALQGPKAEYVLKSLVDLSLAPLPYYRFAVGKICGFDGIVSRTGYTGEDGFEIFIRADDAPEVWRQIMTAGGPLGVLPAGLGARDTLRLEMKYALYGNDIDTGTSPLEAGLGWITKLEKGAFIGREAIVERKSAREQRRLVGFELRGRGIARHGYALYGGGEWVGTVTSGTWSPSLERSIGLGYVPAGLARPGTPLEIEIRGRRVAAEVVKTPFYRQGSVKKGT